jgi:DNA adenine methylase
VIIDTTITRPALRYYGGKWNLAGWIISHFPAHKNYLEPCGGAASVLLQKPPSPLETYNDLDGNVVNFFRVLRNDFDELIRLIELTPWSRIEYEMCHDKAVSPVEQARRFWVLCWMSVQGGTHDSVLGSHWRRAKHADSRRGTPPPKDGTDIYHLYKIANRLKQVQIESDDWHVCLKKYDSPETLIYHDPPYVGKTRGNGNRYALEWSNEQHAEAAELLNQCAGMIVISGYACPLYAELYEENGWIRRDKLAQTNSGGERIESIWISPRTWQALIAERSLPVNLPLFAMETTP